MATGDTLLIFRPYDNEPPSSNYATLDVRNQHPVLCFDATTSEAAVFTGIVPRNYGGGGITVYVHSAAATATSGTIGWLIAFERIGQGSQDIDSDGFASNQTLTAVTVSGTSGNVNIDNVAISNGANMDSIAVGESFRLKIARDTTNDTATGDAHLLCVELKET